MIWAFRQTLNNDYTLKYLPLIVLTEGRGEGDDRGWDGWMASLTRWTWVWVNSGSWWWTGRPGVLRSWCCKESDMTERLNWTELNILDSKTSTAWGLDWLCKTEDVFVCFAMGIVWITNNLAYVESLKFGGQLVAVANLVCSCIFLTPLGKLDTSWVGTSGRAIRYQCISFQPKLID